MERRISIRPLNPNIGAQVTGAHARDMTDADVAAIKDAVVNRCVAVLPGQDLTVGELEDFGARFGEIFIPGHIPTAEGTRCVTELNNMRAFDDPRYRTNRWHTDSTHMERPPSFTFIGCVQPAPDGGGDTMWCNQYLAYETLPDEVKQRIRGLRFNFTIADYYRRHADPGTPPERAHPLVRVHPETGRKSIYFGDLISGTGFEGLPAEEGEVLRAFLYDHSQKPEHCYRHRWTEGDLVIWDNRCTMHYAVLDYAPGDVRTMIRLLVEGEVPIAEVDLDAAEHALVG